MRCRPSIVKILTRPQIRKLSTALPKGRQAKGRQAKGRQEPTRLPRLDAGGSGMGMG